MRAALHYLTFMHHAYLRRILDGRKAVGYHKRGPVLHQTFQGLLHQPLALAVKSRCSLVKYQDRRVLEYGTRY